MKVNNQTFFAPYLYIPKGVTDISFYEKAFGAIEIRRLANDGTVHVAELSIKGALFHILEEKTIAGQLSPVKINGTTALIGMFVQDVDAVMADTVNAGGIVVSPVETYDYGYRQERLKTRLDMFG